MNKAIAAAVCAVLLHVSNLPAATVGFIGSLTAYQSFGGAADPLNLGLPESFAANITTTGSNIDGGQITFTSGSGRSFLIGNAGTIQIGAGFTNFQGMNILGVTGGVLSFNFNQAIGNTTQAGLNQLVNVSGGAILGGGFASPAATGVYSGAVTVVPEPGTMALLTGLVLGCGGYKLRKRKTP